MLSSSFLLLVKVAALCLVPEGCPVENICHNKRIKPSGLVHSSENNEASSIRALLFSYLLPCNPCGHHCSSCMWMGPCCQPYHGQDLLLLAWIKNQENSLVLFPGEFQALNLLPTFQGTLISGSPEFPVLDIPLHLASARNVIKIVWAEKLFTGIRNSLKCTTSLRSLLLLKYLRKKESKSQVSIQAADFMPDFQANTAWTHFWEVSKPLNTFLDLSSSPSTNDCTKNAN